MKALRGHCQVDPKRLTNSAVPIARLPNGRRFLTTQQAESLAVAAADEDGQVRIISHQSAVYMIGQGWLVRVAGQLYEITGEGRRVIEGSTR